MIFGVTTPLASWNPLWANVQFYVQLWRDAVRAGSWWDKLRIWFMPTGWRPADVAAQYPLAKPDLASFRKFEVPLGRGRQCYAALQFAVYVLGTTGLLMQAPQASYAALMIGCGWVAYGLYAIGMWLENRPSATALEWLRLLLNAPLLAAALALGLVPAGVAVWPWLAAYSLLSAAGLLWLSREPAAKVAA